MDYSIPELKKGCFIQQADKNYFSARVKVVGGQVDATHLKKIGEIAATYGNGTVHLTARQCVEIPFVHLDNIEQVKEALAQAGLSLNKCGPCLRTITACQGKIVCKNGSIDTTQLASDLDKRYGAHPLPHKFKIGIAGCKNNCLKAEENDLGIKGGTVPTWIEQQCTYCGACAVKCPANAIAVDKKEKTLHYDQEACVSCGKCVKLCKAWEGKDGFLIYFGGLYGNRIAIGKKLLPMLFTTDALFQVIEATFAFYAQYGNKGERFGNTLDRVGWDLLEQALSISKKND